VNKENCGRGFLWHPNPIKVESKFIPEAHSSVGNTAQSSMVDPVWFEGERALYES
jgi:hypothetical protein